MKTEETLWREDDLARRLCNALEMAQRALGRLGEHGYTSSLDPSLTIRPEKVIAETALLLLYADGVKHIPAVAKQVTTCATQLLPLARSDRLLLGMCLNPALAIDYAQAHACLTRIGYPDKQFDNALQLALSAQAAKGRERPPHRMLEQKWVLELLHPTGVHTPTIAGESAVGVSLDLLQCSRDDGYAFTHALMYLGEPNISQWRLPRSRAATIGQAEALLAWCLDQQDYDLGGELLLAWPLTGKTWTPAAVFGMHVLAAVEDMVGFLPSPATRIEQLNMLAGDERSGYLFATTYHTMYVMGLVCAAMLRPGRRPPRRIKTSAHTGASAALLKLLRTDTEKHWYAVFDTLKPQQQEALASMLFAIAARRAVSANDFEKVHILLGLAQKYGLADTPVASQAAELLQRMAFFAESTGAPAEAKAK